ncbi:MAG: GNAT family N-acetyltransferase [Terriglobia bacterium]
MLNSPHIRIEFLTETERLQECLGIQQKVWGFSDLDLLPMRSLVVSGKIGGQVLGAIDGHDQLVGFLIAVPGFREGKVYLHSHMLGVLPGYRNCGIGKQLKMAQRQDALRRGISHVEWTFDPLEVRNAFFNLESLGAICRHYYVNTYGITSSPLHAALPTDRLVAEWHLSSPRVAIRIAKRMIPWSAPDNVERLTLPLQIDELRRTDPSGVAALQLELRARFLDLFKRGYCVNHFEIDEDKNSACYFLEPFREDSTRI